jgi:hypothetical protein
MTSCQIGALQNNLLEAGHDPKALAQWYRRPIFRVRVDIQIFRERNRAFAQLVLSLNINQPGPEALSKGGHLPGPDHLKTNSSRTHMRCRLDSFIRIRR